MNDQRDNAVSGSLPLVVARIFWMMVGPLTALLLLTGIITGKDGWFTPTDFGFLAVLAGTVLARVFEFRGGNPRTSTGEPALQEDLRRYIVVTLVVGLGAWLTANLVANHWLGQ